MRVRNLGVWISVATLVVLLLSIVPAYVIFFDNSDVVYETQIVNIPLPTDLPGQLPDTLAIVTVQNTGHRPSTELQGSLTFSGDLIEYQVQGPNPAYGQVLHSRKGSQIIFNCARLASGEYPIRISSWYRGATTGPDVGVSDSRGAARKVSSIAAEKAKYTEVGTGILGLLVGLLGSFIAGFASYRLYVTKKIISKVAQEINENTAKVKSMTDQIGAMKPGQ